MTERPLHNALKQKAVESGRRAPHRGPLLPPDLTMIGNRDPNREYRFVARSILDRMGGFDPRGWEVITEKNSKGECLVSPYGTHSSGTTLVNGDTVLAFMPKERMEMKRARLTASNDTIRSAIGETRRMAGQAGLPMEGKVEVQTQGITETY